MREFGRGVVFLLRGFTLWRVRPGIMVLGLVPALFVALVFAAAIIALALAVPTIAQTVTPFADGWDEVWAGLLRTAVSLALLGAAGFGAVISFTAVTLVVGEPVYDRVWRAAEGDDVPGDSVPFLHTVRDALVLVVRGIGVAILAGLVGLVPAVGGVLAFLTGTVLTGWLLADELTSRALTGRGMPAAERRAFRRRHRARCLGFGIATQLCFLVPLGSVAVMPAAVAGSTFLVRDGLGRERARALPKTTGPVA